jgi:hypothetical protein
LNPKLEFARVWGLGVFEWLSPGNDPSDPRSSDGSSDFDRTHVFIISYLYNLPTIKEAKGLLAAAANGWGLTGITTAAAASRLAP